MWVCLEYPIRDNSSSILRTPYTKSFLVGRVYIVLDLCRPTPSLIGCKRHAYLVISGNPQLREGPLLLGLAFLVPCFIFEYIPCLCVALPHSRTHHHQDHRLLSTKYSSTEFETESWHDILLAGVQPKTARTVIT